MAKSDDPIVDRIESLERSVSNQTTKVDEIYALKQTVANQATTINALRAFIQTKFKDDFIEGWGVEYWYGVMQDQKRKEEGIRRATQELERAGYVVMSATEFGKSIPSTQTIPLIVDAARDAAGYTMNENGFIVRKGPEDHGVL